MTVQSCKPKVLAVGEIYTDIPEFEDFANHFEVIRYTFVSREQFISDLKEKYPDIVAIWNSIGGFLNKVGGLAFDSALVDILPASLRIVSVSSIGIDRFDTEALRKRGIFLSTASSSSSAQVADVALFLTLAAFRFTSVNENYLRTLGHSIESKNKLASDSFDPVTGKPVDIDTSNMTFSVGDYIGGKRTATPEGKVAGIVGLGSIGLALAKRLDVIGMDIKYTKRVPLSESELAGLSFKPHYYSDFKEMVKHCDLIAFCVPSTPQTHHLLNKETIELCKPGMRIVNVGRGDVLDEEALLEGLKSGKICSAGLDVFEGEPRVNPKLLNRWDVTVTPHIGSSTLDNRILASQTCIANIKNVVIEDGEGYTVI